MYEFTCKGDGLRVILWDDDGNEIGAAVFNGGKYLTVDPAAAASLKRTATLLPEHCLVCISEPEPAIQIDVTPDTPAPAEAESPAAEDQPAPAEAHRHRARKDKHDA